MGERNFWIEMRAGFPILVWKNGSCRSTTQPELELFDANRELTRQVEQLQAEAKIMRANLVDADDRLAAAEEIMRAIIDDGCGPEESMEDLWDRTVHRIVQHLVRYEALTASPSSSDPGRADTGRK